MLFKQLDLLNIENFNSQNDFSSLDGEVLSNVEVYTKSINVLKENYFFLGRESDEKSLYIVTKNSENEIIQNFAGKMVKQNAYSIKKAQLIHINALLIQKYFSFTKPVLLGLNNSFGFGDRLGFANAGHLRSLGNSIFKPILAQQSIRELKRTQRKPDEVMDAAVWAVFQEGYKTGFGSDADHLKTTDDIDLMINNGFTMFTFDPGDYVDNEADFCNSDDLHEKVKNIPWYELNDKFDDLLSRYGSIKVDLLEGFCISPTTNEIMRAVVKYGSAIAHIFKLATHLSKNYSHLIYEIEVSVDETESVTTPFEHFFIASELNRLGVKIISLAPRFIGEFEKGIDYKGDIELFKKEYLKHIKITEYFGSYKISLHSGSDKFGVYAAIGSLKSGYTHVKTAGTSYLEALKVVATVDKNTFREILDFSRSEFEKEKETYHVSAELKNVKSSSECSDNDLLELFTQNDARQVLHVTFGKVLTTKLDNGTFLFRSRILDCLRKHEDLHYSYLIEHFRNHLRPFEV